jgi:energy-coupling factor transporter ATP-binding protein EcfA2
MAQATIQIIQRADKGEHVFITGMTGSGKSELARFLLGAGGYKRVIVQDGKHEFTAPKEWGEKNKDYGVTNDMYKVDELFKKHGRVIWRPDVEDLEDQAKWHRLDSLYDFI